MFVTKVELSGLEKRREEERRCEIGKWQALLVIGMLQLRTDIYAS